MAWQTRNQVLKEDLPDSEEEPEAYAKKTNCSLEWVRRNKPRSRWICAMAIYTDKKEPWGVIVLDSVDPKPLIRNLQTQVAEKCEILATLLKRWKGLP